MGYSEKILILGSGGREHALAWHLKQSGQNVICAPGSDAISKLVPILKFTSFADLEAQALSHRVTKIIVGPEKYLADGVTNYFEGKGIEIFGPTKEAAKLETDKSFSKDFCIRHQIPTAKATTLTKDSQIKKEIENFSSPYVVKASGLAAGKGVWIGDDLTEAVKNAECFLKQHSSVVVEEFLNGDELSYFVLIDGQNSIFLDAAQDHKRLLENNRGPNTGGMGAYAPVPLLSTELDSRIQKEVVDRILDGLAKDRIQYRGFLFIGLMISNGQPYVLEFNCRMGDPETQAILLRLKTPLRELIDFKEKVVEYRNGATLNVVVAAEGYPDTPSKGLQLEGIDHPPAEVFVFHLGTKWNSSKNVWTSDGGRIFSVATRAESLRAAQNRVYTWIDSLPFKSKVQFRRDIGRKENSLA